MQHPNWLHQLNRVQTHFCLATLNETATFSQSSSIIELFYSQSDRLSVEERETIVGHISDTRFLEDYIYLDFKITVLPAKKAETARSKPKSDIHRIEL